MHGSHSDVYSLGKTIQNMCLVAERHLPAVRVAGVTEVYSDELLTLCRKCCATHPLERPKIHDLYLTTKSKMKFYQYLASIEQAAAFSNLPVSGGMYHSKVLWSAASQRLFEENMTYRDHYVAANLGLVRAAAKGLPRPHPYSSSSSLLPPLLIPPLLIPPPPSPPPPLPPLPPKTQTTKPITKRRKPGSAPLTTTTILDYPVPRAAFSAPPLRPKI